MASCTPPAAGWARRLPVLVLCPLADLLGGGHQLVGPCQHAAAVLPPWRGYPRGRSATVVPLHRYRPTSAPCNVTTLSSAVESEIGRWLSAQAATSPPLTRLDPPAHRRRRRRLRPQLPRSTAASRTSAPWAPKTECQPRIAPRTAALNTKTMEDLLSGLLSFTALAIDLWSPTREALLAAWFGRLLDVCAPWMCALRRLVRRCAVLQGRNANVDLNNKR